MNSIIFFSISFLFALLVYFWNIDVCALSIFFGICTERENSTFIMPNDCVSFFTTRSTNFLSFLSAKRKKVHPFSTHATTLRTLFMHPKNGFLQVGEGKFHGWWGRKASAEHVFEKRSKAIEYYYILETAYLKLGFVSHSKLQINQQGICRSIVILSSVTDKKKLKLLVALTGFAPRQDLIASGWWSVTFLEM